MENRKAARFPLFPIEGWPGKLRFGHRVPQADLKIEHVEDLAGTTYGDWKLRAPEMARRDGYTFHSIINAGQMSTESGADLIVIWSPPVWTAAELATLTAEQRAKGKLIKEHFESQEHSFPPVLEDLQIEYAESPLSVIDRRTYQENVAVSCSVKVSRYVTDVAPDQERTACNEPIPGEVRGTVLGKEVYFPSCLHPRIEMVSLAADGAEIIDCTPDRDGPEPEETRIFHGTNHQQLIPHVYRMTVDDQEDLYIVTEYEVYPPSGIPVIEA